MANATMDKVKAALVSLAQRYGVRLGEWEQEIYEEELGKLPLDRVLMVMKEMWMRRPVKAGMPTVGEIEDKVLGRSPKSEEDAGREVAARIVGAVYKHGSFRTTGDWDAKADVGEFGMAVVNKMFGNWLGLCDTLTLYNEATLTAQLRDLATAMQRRADAGLPDDPPSLPAGYHRTEPPRALPRAEVLPEIRPTNEDVMVAAREIAAKRLAEAEAFERRRAEVLEDLKRRKEAQEE